MPEQQTAQYFDSLADAFQELPENEQVWRWRDFTIREQEELEARAVRPGVTKVPRFEEPEPAEEPTAAPKPKTKPKESVQQRFDEVLDTDALTANQRELIASLDLDPAKLDIATLRNLAQGYGFPEDRAKLARIAAEEEPAFAALHGSSFEPTPEELKSAEQTAREGVATVLSSEYGADGRARVAYKPRKAERAK